MNREEMERHQKKSLLIPKPKFKMGEKVICKVSSQERTIDEAIYFHKKGIWMYSTFEGFRWLRESELELVERNEE